MTAWFSFNWNLSRDGTICTCGITGIKKINKSTKEKENSDTFRTLRKGGLHNKITIYILKIVHTNKHRCKVLLGQCIRERILNKPLPEK